MSYHSLAAYELGGVAQTVFSIPFLYDHTQAGLEVRLDGGLVTSGYTYDPVNQVVNFTVAPKGMQLVIRRKTSIDAKDVTFHPRSILSDAELNRQTNQLFFSIQEAVDMGLYLTDSAFGALRDVADSRNICLSTAQICTASAQTCAAAQRTISIIWGELTGDTTMADAALLTLKEASEATGAVNAAVEAAKISVNADSAALMGEAQKQVDEAAQAAVDGIQAVLQTATDKALSEISEAVGKFPHDVALQATQAAKYAQSQAEAAQLAAEAAGLVTNESLLAHVSAADPHNGKFELAGAVRSVNGQTPDDNGNVTVGTGDVGDATESQKGIVQLATVEESIAGENETKAVTPKGAREAALSVVSEQAAVYGVLYDPSTSNPSCQRVVLFGNTLVFVAAFSELPAHEFKRCVMDNLATRHVNYYLDAHDSTLKADGTASDLTGADGDVMVEIPITYWRYDIRPDGKILYLVSDKEFSGSAIHPFFYVSPDGHTARTQYVGAYQSTICDATGERIANMMNQDATAPSVYVAGYKARSIAGCKPWTSMTQATHRTATANNGGVGVNSLFHQYLMLMMLIEGGSFNTQETISQGFAYASKWNYAFTRLSGRANFGNGTGDILMDSTQDSAITWQSVANALKVVQFSYRGVENPYGEIWKFEDGIQKNQNVIDGVLTDGYWWTADTSLYTDVDQNAAVNPVYTHVAHAWPVSGYVKTWNPFSFFPLTVSGASTTYLCDYFYNDSGADARVVLRGGRVDDGAHVGGGYVHVPTGLAHSITTIGGRLAA